MARKYDVLRAEKTVADINASTDRHVFYKRSRPISSIKQMFESSVQLFGNRPCFKQRFAKGEPFTTITYNQAYMDVCALGTALIDLGFRGKRIAVIGDNSVNWAITYLSVIGGVGIIVPLDKELGKEALIDLCKEAEVSGIIFQGKFEPYFKDSGIKLLINMDRELSGDGVFAFRELIGKGQLLIENGDRRYMEAEVDAEAVSELLFTSGTTGVAKCVMLSQRNLCYELMAAPTLFEVDETYSLFSILPLHHTFECTCNFLIAMYNGSCYIICSGLKYIAKEIKETEPTALFVVPLILENFYKSIWKNIRRRGKEEQAKKVLAACKKLGALGRPIQKLILKDIYSVFGRNMKVIICGGAAIDPAILDFFNDLGYLAVQGYGLTECSPLVSVNPGFHKTMKNKSVGHIMPLTEGRVDNPDDAGIGEICIKGPSVMIGYYNMPEETERVLADGWFHTGDIGYIDDDNFIYITGRSKNVIITANGKNVFPEELEYLISQTGLAEECMVWADKDDRGNNTVITASIYPDKEAVAAESGSDYTQETAEKLINEAVDRLNDTLPGFKQIHRVVVRSEEFEKTTAKKIKRFADYNKNNA